MLPLFGAFNTRWYVSGIEMVLLGGCCAAVAYEIGKLVDGLIGVHEP
jgi:hypothetical protein